MRDGQRKERAKLYTGEHGVWDCTRCMYCNERCPKGVNPRDAIEKLGGIAFQEGARPAGRGRPPREGLPDLDAHRRQAQRDACWCPFTDPIKAPLDMPFALQMLRHGKAPSPIPHKIKKLDEVKSLMKNVKETI